MLVTIRFLDRGLVQCEELRVESWRSYVYDTVTTGIGNGEENVLRQDQDPAGGLALFVDMLLAAHGSDGALRGTENGLSMHFAVSRQIA